jgi:hypothetical protein
MATTELDLSAAEIAEQQGVSVQSFNTWKRIASIKTGKKYGTKHSKAWY